MSKLGHGASTLTAFARYAQRSFTVINASLAYRARFWRAELAVRNLTGRKYYSSITPGTGHGTPGATANGGAFGRAVCIDQMTI